MEGKVCGESMLRRSKQGITRGTSQASRPAAVRCHLVGGCIAFRKSVVRICVGRGPGDRQIISLLYFGEEGVDTSNNPFVSHWLDRPDGKTFDTVVAVRQCCIWGGP